MKYLIIILAFLPALHAEVHNWSYGDIAGTWEQVGDNSYTIIQTVIGAGDYGVYVAQNSEWLPEGIGDLIIYGGGYSRKWDVIDMRGNGFYLITRIGDGPINVIIAAINTSLPTTIYAMSKFTFTNSWEWPAVLEVYDVNDPENVISRQNFSAGETKTWTVIHPDGVTDVSIRWRVSDLNFSDSIWMENDGGETVFELGETYTPEEVEEGSEPETPQTVQAPTQPTGTVSVDTPGGSIWQPTSDTIDTERLDKTTFRQGVDRITQAVATSGSGPATAQLDARLAYTNILLHDGVNRAPLELEAVDASFTPSSAAVNEVLNILPSTSPVMPTSVGETGTFTANLSLGNYGGDFSIEMDLTPYETPIKAMRTGMLGLMGIAFFVSVVKTIKGGFAS